MLKNIVLVFTISLISIMSYRFITAETERKHNVKTQKSKLENNDSIYQDKIDTKTNTIAIQKHTKKVDKTTKKNLPTLDTTSKNVEKEEIFVDYLEDKTTQEIMNDSSLSQKEKDVMIMDKLYFEESKNDFSTPPTDEEIERIMEDDAEYQLSNM